MDCGYAIVSTEVAMGFFTPSFNYKSSFDTAGGAGKRLLGGLENYNAGDYINTGLGRAGKYYKGVLNKMDTGADVSSYLGPELAFLKGQAAREGELRNRRIAGTLAYNN